MGSLDSVYTIREQLTEAIHAHRTETTKTEAIDRAKEVLRTVGMDPSRIEDYPVCVNEYCSRWR
jgi:peptide/nickel transport system ATP-binding protein